MINDELLDGILEWPTVNDVDRLVKEIKRQRLEITHLRQSLETIRDAVVGGHGPLWIEETAIKALEEDFRLK